MIRSFVFSQSQGRLISQDVSLDLLMVFIQDEGVQFWVDAGEVSDEEAKALLDGVFHFHPLAIEDCLAPSERPKIDEYEDYVFMVIHGIALSDKTHEFRTKELNLFIGKNFLVTFHREPMLSVSSTIDRVMRNAPAVARAPDRLTYTLLDSLLENYNPALEQLTADINVIESRVMEQRSATRTMASIQKVLSQVQKLRQIVTPQRELITRLAHGEIKIVRAQMVPYYRDLLDQLTRISIMTDNYRDALNNVVQMHLSLQQMQMNRVVKILTVMATLFMPILVVTSFYGMNFRHWPELESPYAYKWVFSITGISTGLLYLLLKRKGWW